ncbi:MAG: T9SS type A sorting domain-containing protein [Edaphocola sp.]
MNATQHNTTQWPKVLALLLLLCCCGMSYGQATSLFQSGGLAYADLDSTQQVRYATIGANPNVSGIYLVAMDSFSAAQQDGKVLLDLPFLPCGNVLYHVTYVDYTDDGHFAWAGQVKATNESDSLCNDGFLSLVSNTDSGGVLGTFSVKESEYGIYDLGSGVKAIATYDVQRMSEYGCATGEKPTGEDPAAPPFDPGTVEPPFDEACIKRDLRILVLYTPAAKEAVNNDMWLDATKSVTDLNNIWANSQVPYTATLAAAVEIPGYVETENIIYETENIALNATAQAIRNTYRADVVVLMGKKDYEDEWGDKMYGNSRQIACYNYVDRHDCDSAGQIDPAYAFAVVDVNNNHPDWIFSHEVSHLLGAKHEGDDCAILDASARGRKFTKWWTFIPVGHYRTVETTKNIDLLNGYTDFVRKVVPYLSNPNVTYNSVATGTSDRNDADRVQQLYPTIASFYTETSSFSNDFTVVYNEYPEGSPFLSTCKYASATLTASASCGVTPYVHTWLQSTDGIAWTTIGTGSTITVGATTYNVLIKLKTQGLGGLGASVYKQGMLDFNCTLYAEMATQSAKANYNVTKSEFGISPNPANNIFTLSYTQPGAEDVSISLNDVTGRLVATLYKGMLHKGSGSLALGEDLSITPGLYMVHIRGKRTNQTFRIVIQ